MSVDAAPFDLAAKFKAAETAMASGSFREAGALFAQCYVAANSAVAALPPGQAPRSKLTDVQVRACGKL